MLLYQSAQLINNGAAGHYRWLSETLNVNKLQLTTAFLGINNGANLKLFQSPEKFFTFFDFHTISSTKGNSFPDV